MQSLEKLSRSLVFGEWCSKSNIYNCWGREAKNVCQQLYDDDSLDTVVNLDERGQKWMKESSLKFAGSANFKRYLKHYIKWRVSSRLIAKGSPFAALYPFCDIKVNCGY